LLWGRHDWKTSFRGRRDRTALLEGSGDCKNLQEFALRKARLNSFAQWKARVTYVALRKSRPNSGAQRKGRPLMTSNMERQLRLAPRIWADKAAHIPAASMQSESTAPSEARSTCNSSRTTEREEEQTTFCKRCGFENTPRKSFQALYAGVQRARRLLSQAGANMFLT
jgi:hypothetical protein